MNSSKHIVGIQGMNMRRVHIEILNSNIVLNAYFKRDADEFIIEIHESFEFPKDCEVCVRDITGHPVINFKFEYTTPVYAGQIITVRLNKGL